ncbi:MAG TPA: hypothetical protein VKQ36_00450 [Ktedonobacterales bacterium]|nr:hypothetical protein [Ktedonobacterales bacterium]
MTETTQSTRIELWQVLNYGASFQAIVEVAEDGTVLQAMVVNTPRDELYCTTHRDFNEPDTLQDVLDAPRHHIIPCLDNGTPASTLTLARAAVAADEWTKAVTKERMSTLNMFAKNPAYKTADGTFNFAKIEAACGFSLKELKAAAKRHGL